MGVLLLKKVIINIEVPMSWLFGVYRKNESVPVNCSDIKNKINTTPLFTLKRKDLFVIAGGIGETCKSSLSIENEKDSGWIVCGTGIQVNGINPSYMDVHKWESAILSKEFDHNSVDGHYAVVKWSENGIKLYTDVLGVRKIYLTEDENFYYFSSRLDWLLRFRQNNEIDYVSLSCSWLLLYKFNTDNSIIKGIKRLGPCANVSIKKQQTSIKNTLWSPTPITTDVHSMVTLLENLTVLPFEMGKNILLCLSGGMDSRTLLTLLNKYPKEKWSTFLFGEKEHPDVIVGKQIANKCDIELIYKDVDFRKPELMMKTIEDVALQMEMAFILSSSDLFVNMPDLHKKNFFVIDGAAGEFMRKRTGNRLLYNYKNGLDPRKTMSLLCDNKPNIFDPVIMGSMLGHSITHVENAIKQMPKPNAVNASDWVDQFIIRYAFWGEGPGLIDSLVPNYMPYIQPNLLNHVLNIPVKEKINNKINRRLIKSFAKILKKFPLVREGIVAPYSTCQNNILSTLWTRGSGMLKGRYIDQNPALILKHLREPIMDRLLSQSVKTFDQYNYPLINTMVKQFYDYGMKNNAGDIFQWLAFDIWRERL